MKENCPLMRQGRAFKINLGLANGPFLAKDISQTNQNSITLLAAKEVLSSQQTTSQMLKFVDKQQKNELKMLKSSNIENAFCQMNFFKNELETMERNFSKIKQEKTKLKFSMQEMKEKVEEQNNGLLEENMPYLRKLLKLIKDQNMLQKAVNDDHQKLFCSYFREIESLLDFRNKFLDQIVKCETKIIKVQNYLGYFRPSQNINLP